MELVICRLERRGKGERAANPSQAATEKQSIDIPIAIKMMLRNDMLLCLVNAAMPLLFRG